MISLENITFGYGSRPVISDLSLTWQAGTITALVGPNGSGKSTCLKLAAGLLAPQKGRILLDQTPLDGHKGRMKGKQIAFLPQNRPVPMITVRSLVSHGRFPHVGLGRRLTKEDTQAVDRALEMTGLLDLADRDVRTLSGGQQQKVYLALLIAQDAPHLLLDEPTTYLDIRHQLELFHLLKTFKAAGKCVVVVLHDLNQALSLGDTVQLMAGGRLLYNGAPQGLAESGAIEEAFGVRPLLSPGLNFELMA